MYCSIRNQLNTVKSYKEIGMEHKELYKTVELDVITFASEDVIVTSDQENGLPPEELVES